MDLFDYNRGTEVYPDSSTDPSYIDALIKNGKNKLSAKKFSFYSIIELDCFTGESTLIFHEKLPLRTRTELNEKALVKKPRITKPVFDEFLDNFPPVQPSPQPGFMLAPIQHGHIMTIGSLEYSWNSHIQQWDIVGYNNGQQNPPPPQPLPGSLWNGAPVDPAWAATDADTGVEEF